MVIGTEEWSKGQKNGYRDRRMVIGTEEWS